MKKLIALLLAVFMLIMPSFCAFAEVDGEEDSGEIYISDEDFEKLEHVDAPNNGISTYASGLITTTSLSLAKDGDYLYIMGSTKCTDAVKKCGFTYIKLQQYKNGSWVDYRIYEDLYSDSYTYRVTRYLAAKKGYKYRLVAQHYAKKNIFSTEKINNSTPSFSFYV